MTNIGVDVNLIPVMVNISKNINPELSTKAKLLMILRDTTEKPISGSKLAASLGISRVAIWKGIQSLAGAGYSIEASDSGYTLDLEKAGDFLYPWEFGDKEAMFRHFDTIDSTMDKAKECALNGFDAGTIVIAESQSAGRGRYGRKWNSRQGGLYFTILDRPRHSWPKMTLADYSLLSMLYQIAVGRALNAMTGKPAQLRWPNDVYMGGQKIAGLITELSGESDSISWMLTGIGVNVNNAVALGRAVNCVEVSGRPLSRRDLLLSILDELERLKNLFSTGAAYAQGNRLLAAEWNAMADNIGMKAAVIDSGFEDDAAGSREPRVFARGVYSGIDPAGRCIIKADNQTLYFNPGPISVVFPRE